MRYIFSLLALCMFSLINAQPGSLDQDFGSGGKVVASLGNNNAVVNAVGALQADGKIVVAGTIDSAYNKRTFAMRFNADGSRDYTYAGGFAIQSSTNGRDSILAVAIQSDGKMVAAGISGGSGNVRKSLLFRYNTDGTLDNTFGTNGKIVFNATGNNGLRSIALQSDNKIVVAGFVISGNADRFMVIRLNENGTTDNTFGTQGIASFTIDGLRDQAYAVAIQADGKIVAGGLTYYAQDGSRRFGLARLTSSGQLDATFGTGGKLSTEMGRLNGESELKALAITADQKIIAGGVVQNGFEVGRDFGIVRYHTNGVIDSSFGYNGKTDIDFGNNDDLRALTIKTNGKIVMAGNSLNYTGLLRNFALAQYKPNGNPDVTFGAIGEVTTNINEFSDVAHTALVQPDSKIVLVGMSGNGSNNLVGIIRYIGEVEDTTQPVSVQELSPEMMYSIYPNPVQNVLKVKAHSNAEATTLYKVINMNGCIMDKGVISNNETVLNVSEYAKGVYLLHLTSAGKYSTLRFTKR